MGKEIKNTSFENGIKESFSGFTYPPAPAVWSKVEAGLHRKRRILLYTRLAAAASFLFLFGISGWIFYQNISVEQAPAALSQKQIKPVIEQKEIAGSLPQTTSKTRQQELPEPVIQAEQNFDNENEVIIANLFEANSTANDDSKVGNPAQEEKLAEAESANSTGDVAVKTVKNEEPAANHSTETLTLYDQTLYDDNLPEEKSKEKSWKLGVGYGTTAGNSGSDPAVSYESNSANFSEDYFSSELSAETKLFEDLENTTHSHPISVGIMINKSLSDKWGLESGLLFTRLKTRATTNPENNSYTEYVSEIFYLGLPITVRFSIINGRRFGLYASQGLVLEKGVSVKYYTNTYSNNVLTDNHTSSYTADGVQLSSLTAAGLEYKFNDLMSIYLQPGFQVFFLNQTQPYNIRSSSSFWPSIQTGLRFQL